MVDPVSTAISGLALIVSASTAWLTYVRRGTVKMTRPTQIFFGEDVSSRNGHNRSPKIYLRALLFATGARGRVIESMHVCLANGEMTQTFNIWVYGQREKLVRGSGVFVPPAGVEANHHFLISPDVDAFCFTEGSCRIDVYAHLVGDRRRRLLFSDVLNVTAEAAKRMSVYRDGLYFDWASDLSHYVSHIEPYPGRPGSWDLGSFAREEA